jgi:hypothetical protein
MEMPDDVQSAIQQNAQGPSMARGRSGEQVESDKYLAANQAFPKMRAGIRSAKLQAPGTVY